MSEARKACVIGWPIEHSRSPLIHGHWLATYGIAGTYERRAVPPNELMAFVDELRGGNFVGGNVTIPHKEAMAGVCDRLTPLAARLGSVNTVWLEGATLHGDSTDALGFIAALDDELPHWDGRLGRALVIGAGGAARPIVDALLRRGFGEVAISSRTDARAQALAREIGCAFWPFGEVEADLETVDLLVNASPAGMAGHAPLTLDLRALPDDAIVDDIVYAPAMTPLLAAAQARGLRTIGGLGMLLHQAAPGFERWFGTRPEVTSELRALVAADVARAR